MTALDEKVHPLLDRPTESEAPFGAALLEAADRHPELVVLAADLSRYTDVRAFADTYPERFIQVGMAEQDLMGIGGGVAKTGLLPVITTYCVFASRRAYEQVALALCTGARPAVIAAFLPGITTPFRATHQGTDDLALMRNIPGMTVIDPMDSTDISGALAAAVEHSGTVYLRGLRGKVARYLDPDVYDFQIGSTYLLRAGTDVGVISTGLGSQWALEAVSLLQERGIEAAVLHAPTIKPLDAESILAFAGQFDLITTVENHNRIGGLGTSVAEVLAEAGSRTRLIRLGVPDKWAPAGSVNYIRTQLRLDAIGLANSITNAIQSAPAQDQS